MKRNMIYKLILGLFLVMLGVQAVSAVTLNDAVNYYSMDNDTITGATLIDLANNQNGTITGATGNFPGILNQSIDFDGINDDVYIGTSAKINNVDFTISTWINTSADGVIMSSQESVSPFDGVLLLVRPAPDNDVRLFIGGNTANANIYSNVTVNNGTWVHVIAMHNEATNTHDIYVNGKLVGTSTLNVGDYSTSTDMDLGVRHGTLDWFDGQIDEFGLWNRTLNSSEIAALYNNGTGFNPYTSTPPANETLTFNTIELNNASILVNNYINDTTPTFFTNVTNTSTNGNVNQTFYLYNGSNVLINSTQYATNSLTGTFTTTVLPDDIYKIWFYALNNETNVSSINYTIYVDTVPPVIQQIANVSQQSYAVNFSTILNVTDALSGLATCTINITELQNVTTPDNFFINCTDTQTFTSAGLHNGFVEARDNAGNLNTYSFNFTINPFIYVRWINNVTGANLTNYQVSILHPDLRVTTQNDVNGTIALSPVNNGTLDLGNHTLTFIKDGFLQLNYTVNINESSGGTNYTFNATPVTLTMRMFDFGNVSDQLNFTVTISNGTSTVVFTNQLTLVKQYSEIPIGVLNMVVESDGFKDAFFYNTITPFTSIVINGFMISNTTASTVTFRVTEFGSDKALEDVIIEAQKLVNGTFVTVSQAQTDGTGQTFMSLDITETYKFIFSKTDYISNTANSIPGVTVYNVRLTFEQQPFDFLSEISTQLLPVNSLLFNDNNYSMSGFVSGASLSLSSLRIVDQNNTLIYFDSSINPTGSTFSYNLVLPVNQTNITQVTMTLTYIRNGKTNTVVKTYTVSQLTPSIIEIMKDYDGADEDSSLMRWLVMVIAIAASILAGRLVGANATGSSLLIVVVAGFFAFVGWMPVNYFAAMSGAAIFFFIGGRLIR